MSRTALTFDLQTRPSEGSTRLPCEFGANPFSGSRNISYKQKKPQTDGTKNRTFCSSQRVVIMTESWSNQKADTSVY